MQFANISGLWFSLALPAIVMLYLLKRRYAETEVSSHMLWKRVLQEQEANRPWRRLQKQLLLWLQLLAAALGTFALMQPYVSDWAGSSAKANLLFVLDASGSMQAMSGGITRMEQAERQMLSYAKEHAPASAYSLIVIKDQPEIALQRQTGAAALEAALGQVTPSFGRTGYAEALSLASALTRDDPHAEVRVYTDQQWTEGAEGIVFSVPVTIEQPEQSDTPQNVSVAQFGVKRAGEASKQQAVAVLKNWGAAPAALQATVYGADEALEVQEVRLQAGEQQVVFFDNLKLAEFYKLALDVTDALEVDNTAYAFADRQGASKQAVYVGEGNLFLEKALALAQIGLLKITKSEDGTYPLPASGEQQLIILDGVQDKEIAGDAWQQLLRHTPLLTFPSGSSGQGADPPFTAIDHPVLRFIRLQDVHISSVSEASPAGMSGDSDLAWAHPILLAGQRPLLLAGSEQGVPRLLFTFSLQQSDLALRAEFPILMQNAASWLSGGDRTNLGRLLAGERKELGIHREAVKALWQSVPEQDAKQAADQVGGKLTAAQTIPATPGLYRFVEYDSGGNVVQSRLAESAMDSRESDINGRLEPKWSIAGSEQGAAEHAEEPAGQAVSGASLVPWMTALLLALLLLEWEVYRRGYPV